MSGDGNTEMEIEPYESVLTIMPALNSIVLVLQSEVNAIKIFIENLFAAA